MPRVEPGTWCIESACFVADQQVYPLLSEQQSLHCRWAGFKTHWLKSIVHYYTSSNTWICNTSGLHACYHQYLCEWSHGDTLGLNTQPKDLQSCSRVGLLFKEGRKSHRVYSKPFGELKVAFWTPARFWDFYKQLDSITNSRVNGSFLLVNTSLASPGYDTLLIRSGQNVVHRLHAAPKGLNAASTHVCVCVSKNCSKSLLLAGKDGKEFFDVPPNTPVFQHPQIIILKLTTRAIQGLFQGFFKKSIFKIIFGRGSEGRAIEVLQVPWGWGLRSFKFHGNGVGELHGP